MEAGRREKNGGREEGVHREGRYVFDNKEMSSIGRGSGAGHSMQMTLP